MARPSDHLWKELWEKGGPALIAGVGALAITTTKAALRSVVQRQTETRDLYRRRDEFIAKIPQILDRLEEITCGVESLVEAQHAAQQDIHAIASLTNEPVWQSTSEGQCLFATQALADLMGIEVLEMRGDGWLTGIHPDDRDRVAVEYRRACESGRVYQQHYRYLHPDGAVVHVSGRAVPIKTRNGQVVRYMGRVTVLDPAEWHKRQGHPASAHSD